MAKVLVIRLSSLGDVILASSVIQPLYDRGFHIELLTFDSFAGLFEEDYRIKKLITPSKEELSGLKNIIQYAKKIGSYDYVLDLHRNLRSIIISSVVSGKTVRYRKNSLKRRLYTRPFFRRFIKTGRKNVVEMYTDTLKYLGINVEKPRPYIPASQKAVEKVKDILPENFITIGTGARYRNKIYPFYSQVAGILEKEGFKIVLIGSEEDKQSYPERFPETVIDLRGKLNLKESLAVISLSELTVSNDSAVAHMARAVKTPVLMIYGATSPYFGFYPFPDEGKYLYKGLPCQPCDLHGKKECIKGKPECLEFEPQYVAQEALKLLKKSL
ncbi:glycosyltransferase family 9 protein [Persephonella sp.]